MNGSGASFTNKAQDAILSAQSIAQERGQQQIDALHLLYALLGQEGSLVITILQKLGADIDALKKKTESQIFKISTLLTPTAFGQFYLTQDMAKVLDKARIEAANMQDEFISVEHLFLALLDQKSMARDVLEKANLFGIGNSAQASKLSYDEVLRVLSQIRGGQRITDPEPESKYQVIEKYTRNLTDLAAAGKIDPIIGRDNEIRRLMQIISRRTKNNPVLIGEAGVGKTAIVEGFAQRVARGNVPEFLKNKEVISLDLGSIIAGTKYRGEFETRIKALLKEISRNSNKYIIFIDELHTLVGAGAAEGAIDASNLLKPALARGELRAIKAAVELSSRYIADRFLPDKAVDLMDEAASALRLEIESEPQELEKHEEEITKLEIEKQALKKEKGSEKRLKVIARELADIKEKTKDLSAKWKAEKELINKIREIREKIDELSYQTELAQREADLEKVAEIKYGKIPQLLKEQKAVEQKLVKLQKTHHFLKEEVNEEDVAKVVSRWTGIPVTRLITEEAKKLETMEATLNRRVIGQEEAISAISRAIRRARAGISEENKPLGSFLFLGPTGVGKTETARALAEFLFNDEKAMIRLDMSEYMERHTVSKMIGSPPGYVGYEEAGQLTEKVRRRPYAVILLDEIEKAHPDVFNILLQIFEDGRLTDSKGRMVSFKNTIIIMTSNVGSNFINKMSSIGFSNKEDIAERESMKDKITNSLKDQFRPEFLNRIDEIVIFNYLKETEIKTIVDLELAKVEKRLKAKEISIQISQKAKEFLVREGFDANLGARPLKRVIQRLILDPLSVKIVINEIIQGSRVLIDEKNGQIVFDLPRLLARMNMPEKVAKASK